MRPTTPDDAAAGDLRSAYGLNFAGLDAGPEWYNPPEAGAPVVQVRHDGPLPDGGHTEPRVGAQHAVFRLGPDRLAISDALGATTIYRGIPVPPDELVHPLLMPVASVHNRWLGREAFHAGAFAVGGEAWAVAGPPEAGKSSFLAGLVERGITVLTDDMTVTDGDDVFSGPRSIDLRKPLPDSQRDLEAVRGRTRYRMLLPPSPFRMPLGGWIRLRWGDELSMELLPAEQRVRWLAKVRWRRAMASDPLAVLGLAGRPAWTLTRPRSWSAVDTVVATLMDAIATHQVARAELGADAASGR